MTKSEFLEALKKGLSGLPQDDIEERLNFYSEIIDDKIEEGISETDAVLGVGNVQEIISQIVADIPLSKLVKEKIKPKRAVKIWEIVLLALGFPLWFPLLIAGFAVILALYLSVWSVIISLWAVFASVIACAFSGIISGVVLTVFANVYSGIAMIGAAVVCAGLSIFLFYGCKAATKGILWMTRKFVVYIKNCFVKKEEA